MHFDLVMYTIILSASCIKRGAWMNIVTRVAIYSKNLISVSYRLYHSWYTWRRWNWYFVDISQKTKTISSAFIYNVYKSPTTRRGLLKSTISTIIILEWINDCISCVLNINETIYNMRRRKLSCLADNITSTAIDESTQLNVLSRQGVKLLS